MHIKIQLADQPRLLATEPGAVIGGQPIVQTVEGGPHAIVEIPDSWEDADIDAWACELETAGLLYNDGELWRHEKTLRILGYPSIAPQDVLAQWVAGDTFAALGITPETRARGNWGRGVKVALLDTGLHGAHPWFAAMLTDGRLEGDLTDSHGHGTHCGGVITGQYGVAPGCMLRSWNVLPGGTGSEAGIAAGIDQAVNWGARVISMSLGGAGNSGVINQSVARARQRGVYVTSAAGNGSSAQPVGSPAIASSAVVMAHDRATPPRWAAFTDGRHAADAQLPRVARPGVQIISSVPDGERAMDGTSMACPHHAGMVTLLLGAGLSAAEVELYTASHMGAPPDGKLSKLLEDFGAGEGPPPPTDPPPTDDVTQTARELQQAIEHLDVARYIYRDSDPDAAWTWVGEASRIMGVARDRLPKVPGEPDVPPPVEPPTPVMPQLRGVAVTYAGGHNPARDVYLGYTDEQVQWGRHDLCQILAPAPGTVSRYAFPTPLGMLQDAPVEYQMAYHALFDDWVCSLPATDLRTLGQEMVIAVYVPDQPVQTSHGRVVALWCGHVRSAVRTGRVQAGELFAEAGASGIQFERAGVPNARAAHVHLCASASGQLSQNGDLDGLAAAEALGWSVQFIGSDGPGPTQYMSGRYTAGRLTTDFTQAGKPIPPMALD